MVGVGGVIGNIGSIPKDRDGVSGSRMEDRGTESNFQKCNLGAGPFDRAMSVAIIKKKRRVNRISF